MTVIIDRITDGVAVLELPDRRRLEVPAKKLPSGANEGDCLSMTEDGGFVLDEAETARRRKANAELFKRLLDK